MKKALFLACGLAMAGIASVNAQTKIYVTGSTAFRSAAIQGIQDALTGETASAFDNATIASANAVTFTGGTILVSGVPTAVTVKVSWSGSAAGIQTVAATTPALTARFIQDGASGLVADPRTVSNPAEVATPDFTFSDNFQGSCPFKGSFSSNFYSTLIDKQVGVVTFKWVASDNFPVTNVTDKQVRPLFAVGSMPLALFTGLNSDEDKIVYATGRNPDSGTRITAFAESGYGALNVVQQYKPTVTGGSGGKNGTVTAVTLYPIETINGVSTGVDGNSGESSGGTLRNYVTHTFNQASVDPTYTAGYFLTYLGVSDYNSVAGDGVVSLKWNGVDFTEEAVREGAYTFWGYEHLMYKSGLTGAKLSFATGLESTVKNVTTLTPNVRLSTMQVSRSGDGADIFPDYF